MLLTYYLIPYNKWRKGLKTKKRSKKKEGLGDPLGDESDGGSSGQEGTRTCYSVPFEKFNQDMETWTRISGYDQWQFFIIRY